MSVWIITPSPAPEEMPRMKGSASGFRSNAWSMTPLIASTTGANVIGLGLGTLFRFWSYRRWVFPEDAEAADEAAISTSA